MLDAAMLSDFKEKQMRPMVVVLALAHVLLTRADACSCAKPTAKGSMAGADVAFLGKIVASRGLADGAGSDFGEETFVLRFEVVEMFQGESVKTITLVTKQNRVSCDGLLGPLDVGTTWVIFGRRRGEESLRLLKEKGLPELVYDTTICSGNMFEQARRMERRDFERYVQELRKLKR